MDSKQRMGKAAMTKTNAASSAEANKINQDEDTTTETQKNSINGMDQITINPDRYEAKELSYAIAASIENDSTQKHPADATPKLADKSLPNTETDQVTMNPDRYNAKELSHAITTSIETATNSQVAYTTKGRRKDNHSRMLSEDADIITTNPDRYEEKEKRRQKARAFFASPVFAQKKTTKEILTAPVAQILPGTKGLDPSDAMEIFVTDAVLVRKDSREYETAPEKVPESNNRMVKISAVFAASSFFIGLLLFFGLFDHTVTQNNVKERIKKWKSGEETKQIGTWDVSSVHDMSRLFEGVYKTFDVDGWDTAEVAIMEGLFMDTKNFNSPIGGWDVSNVVQMQMMFQNALSFNQDLSEWDLGKVFQVQNMFKGARSYESYICWNVSRSDLTFGDVFEGSSGCFCGQTEPLVNTSLAIEVYTNDPHLSKCTYGKLQDWDLSKVTNMTELFLDNKEFTGGFNSEKKINETINTWDVSSVVDMTKLFRNTTAFNGVISNWDVSGVQKMRGVFEYTDFNQNINSWDVSVCTEMHGTFYRNNDFDQPLYNWDVSSVTTMRAMFNGADVFNQDISMWDVSNVLNMKAMLADTKQFYQDLQTWNVTKVNDHKRFCDGSKLEKKQTVLKIFSGCQ